MANEEQQAGSNDVKAVFNPDTGETDNYFGGEGRADGPGHGHVTVNDQGEPTHPKGGRPAQDQS